MGINNQDLKILNVAGIKETKLGHLITTSNNRNTLFSILSPSNQNKYQQHSTSHSKSN